MSERQKHRLAAAGLACLAIAAAAVAAYAEVAGLGLVSACLVLWSIDEFWRATRAL